MEKDQWTDGLTTLRQISKFHQTNNVTCISVKPFPNGSIKRKIGKFVVMSTGQIKSKSSSISFSSFPKIKRLTIVKTFSLFCVKEQTRIAAKTLSTVN